MIRYLEELIKIKKIILRVREELDNSDNYKGLCDEACQLFKKYISTNESIEFIQCHGELKHTFKIDPHSWNIEHSWIKLKFTDGFVLYIDPTSQQFRDLYPDIPDYYMSQDAPIWYYSDKDNICFKYKFINKHKYIFRIVSFCQYGIYGTICKMIRFFIYKGRV
jgi:hypothetical protein